MISVPNSTIELPNYAERETLERLSTQVVITEERRKMGLKCCAKLRAIINGQAKPNKKLEQNKKDGSKGAKHSDYVDLVERVANMTPAQRQEYSL